MIASFATADTVRVEQASRKEDTHVRPVVQQIRANQVQLDRRLCLARAFIRAHRTGGDPGILAQLDAAYVATRAPLEHGESYDEG